MSATVIINIDQHDELNLCLRRASAVSALLSACRQDPDIPPETVPTAGWIIRGELEKIREILREASNKEQGGEEG